MRVLFVVPYAPSRIRVRSFGFIRHLARQHNVHVLALGAGSLSAGELMDLGTLRREGIPVTIIREPRHQPYLRTLASALVPRRDALPLQVAYTASPVLRAAIATELRAHSYDVLHVEHVRGLSALPAALDLPVVWDAVDCVSLLFAEGARYAAQQRRISPIRVAGPQEARRMAAFERQGIARFHQVLVTSERDRQALLDLAGAQAGTSSEGSTIPDMPEMPDITVLPHGVDVARSGQGERERQADTLIFSGKMNYHANIEGALWLAREIMPLVWVQHPDTRLIIAGNDPTWTVRRLASDQRVSVTGYVRDLGSLVASATVAISPLPYAVGIQNKLLEAMAAGTPVVASAIAAQGLGALPGRDLLVAETAEDLAAALLRLLDDANLRAQVGASGQRYVTEHHRWDVVIEQLTAVYERAGATDSARPHALAAPASAANGTNGSNGSHGTNGHNTYAARDYLGGWKARRARGQQAVTPAPAAALAVEQNHAAGEESAS